VNYLSNMTIRLRLTIGFGFVLMLIVILTILGIQKVNFINSTLTQITDINAVKQRYAINYRGSVHDRAIAIRDIALAENNEQIAIFENEISELEDFYNESERNMQAMIDAGVDFSGEISILNKIQGIKEKTLPLIKEITQAKKNNQDVDAQVLRDARPAFIAYLNTINEFIDYQENANQMATPKAREVAENFQELMLWLSAIAIIISVLVGITIERSIFRSIGKEPSQAKESLMILAEGDLTTTIETNYSDSMIAYLSLMRKKMAAIISDIIHTSNDLSNELIVVSDNSKQVLTAVKNQATLTHDTVSQLENIRASSDQVSQVIARTEENSSMTVKYAKEGRKIINSSANEMDLISTTVNTTVEQIRLLAEHTKKIGGIVSVISGISEQTNLLALNAAIEAARAGDTGRGFAVVADEVRQLAQRTGAATSEIEKMIVEVQEQTNASVLAMEMTQPQVENGRTQILKATELLQSIEQQASDSFTQVQEVVKAASSQGDSINEITRAMDKIAEMSGESINSINNNNVATDTLSQLAKNLKTSVGFFKT
jgi:methyl-accepting chemotaxis protein